MSTFSYPKNNNINDKHSYINLSIKKKDKINNIVFEWVKDVYDEFNGNENNEIYSNDLINDMMTCSKYLFNLYLKHYPYTHKQFFQTLACGVIMIILKSHTDTYVLLNDLVYYSDYSVDKHEIYKVEIELSKLTNYNFCLNCYNLK